MKCTNARPRYVTGIIMLASGGLQYSTLGQNVNYNCYHRKCDECDRAAVGLATDAAQ